MTAVITGLAVIAAALTRPGGARVRTRATAGPVAMQRVPAAVLAAGLVVMCAVAGVAVPMLAAAGGAAAAGVVWRRRRARARTVDARRRDVVTLTYAVAAELRAGRAPADALAAVAPQLVELSTEVTAAARAVRRGGDVGAELHRVARVAGAERLEQVADVWAVGVAAGARIGDVLDEAAAAFDAEDCGAEELSALAAGPRATVVLLAVLPLGGLALGTAMGASPWRLLVHTRLGWLLVAAALLLDAAGLLWMRRLTSSGTAW